MRAYLRSPEVDLHAGNDGGHFIHFGRAKSWSQRRTDFFPAGT